MCIYKQIPNTYFKKCKKNKTEEEAKDTSVYTVEYQSISGQEEVDRYVTIVPECSPAEQHKI